MNAPNSVAAGVALFVGFALGSVFHPPKVHARNHTLNRSFRSPQDTRRTVQ
jgi:hypothetical protein